MNAFLKLQQIRDVLYGRERNRLQAFEQVTLLLIFTLSCLQFLEEIQLQRKNFML